MARSDEASLANHASPDAAATEPHGHELGPADHVLVGHDRVHHDGEPGARGHAVVQARRALGPLIESGLAALDGEDRFASPAKISPTLIGRAVDGLRLAAGREARSEGGSRLGVVSRSLDEHEDRSHRQAGHDAAEDRREERERSSHEPMAPPRAAAPVARSEPPPGSAARPSRGSRRGRAGRCRPGRSSGVFDCAGTAPAELPPPPAELSEPPASAAPAGIAASTPATATAATRRRPRRRVTLLSGPVLCGSFIHGDDPRKATVNSG